MNMIAVILWACAPVEGVDGVLVDDKAEEAKEEPTFYVAAYPVDGSCGSTKARSSEETSKSPDGCASVGDLVGTDEPWTGPSSCQGVWDPVNQMMTPGPDDPTELYNRNTQVALCNWWLAELPVDLNNQTWEFKVDIELWYGTSGVISVWDEQDVDVPGITGSAGQLFWLSAAVMWNSTNGSYNNRAYDHMIEVEDELDGTVFPQDWTNDFSVRGAGSIPAERAVAVY